MIFVDDRTDEEKITHPIIVMMTDTFLSGWGAAKDGPSYAGWAVPLDDLDAMEARIRARSDAKRVRIVGGDYRPPSRAGHCHIYVGKI